MFYIVGFDEENLEVLDSDDGVVDKISYTEFFDNYYTIKPYLLSNFYLIEGADSVFDVFDRNNIRTPALSILFDKLGIKSQSDYYSKLNEGTITEYRVSDVKTELRSYSFVTNIHRFEYKSDVIKLQDRLLNLVMTDSLNSNNISAIEAQILFDYYSDYIKMYGTGHIKFALDYLKGNCTYIMKNDCYIIRCCTNTLAKLLMFALVAQKTGYLSNLNVIEYVDPIFSGLKDILGNIVSINLDKNIITVMYVRFLNSTYLTKKSVLLRGSLNKGV